MRLTNNIFFKNFKIVKEKKNIRRILSEIIYSKNEIINSLKKSYKNSFEKNKIQNLKRYSIVVLIGMGGSILGAKAIYSFLKHKVKKSFFFIDNLNLHKKTLFRKKIINLIISKSGNTLETIVNLNILLKKSDKNIFITENKQSYLRKLAENIKAEVFDHNNYIGGRYSVLSEVGMLPSELMGLKPEKFRQLNNLIKNKKFIDALITNVSSIIFYLKNKKFNSVIINYDESSTNLFNWYQQLVAESLGKNKLGILPIVSNMPKDNHSVMQLYLDGFQNNFLTFFFVNEMKSPKINNTSILHSHNFLKNKSLNQILYAQKNATEIIFKKKNIPFRSFEIKKRDEKTLGELFCFFILETILIGRALKVNPYNQPAVELIKKETKKLLI